MAFASQGRIVTGHLYEWKCITWGNARFSTRLVFKSRDRNHQRSNLLSIETEAKGIDRGNPLCNTRLAFKNRGRIGMGHFFGSNAILQS